MISVQLGLLSKWENVSARNTIRNSALTVRASSRGLRTNKSRNTYLTNFWRTLVMIFAEWAILLLGSLKVRALCAIYLASQINAERRLWITKAEQMKRNITHHFSLLCISWTRFKDKSGPKVEEKIGRNWPVESVNEPQSDGAQICGIGNHGAVAGILDQVHGTRERSCNLCGTNTERTSVRIRQMWANDNDDNMSVNMKERIRGWNQTNWKIKKKTSIYAYTPTVMSWSMLAMSRSHSSSLLLSPHSPGRGLYISSLISSAVTGIPPPSVSGCGAAQQRQTLSIHPDAY